MVIYIHMNKTHIYIRLKLDIDPDIINNNELATWTENIDI